MGLRSQVRFISALATIFVSGFFFSSSQAATPEAKDKFTALKYQDLRPRLLVRAEGKGIVKVVRDPTFIFSSADGYSPELSFTEDLKYYPEKQLFRVVYTSRSDDLKMSPGGQLESTGNQLIHMTLQPVGADLRANGEQVEVATKAKPGDDVKELKGFNDERISRLSSLVYSRAQVNDILLNTLDYHAEEGVIPGGSRLQVIKIEKEWRRWTFVSNYHLTVRVSPCPASLRDNNCEARLINSNSYPDHRFGHWVHPKNVRAWHIWGITVVY